jgi:hypothetical protein
MSWLLFLDESGHDHKNMPCEVRVGAQLGPGAFGACEITSVPDLHEAPSKKEATLSDPPHR